MKIVDKRKQHNYTKAVTKYHVGDLIEDGGEIYLVAKNWKDHYFVISLTDGTVFKSRKSLDELWDKNHVDFEQRIHGKFVITGEE